MAFLYRLEHEDGTPDDPPSFQTSVPTWGPGDTIPLGRGQSLRVIERAATELDSEPVRRRPRLHHLRCILHQPQPRGAPGQ